MAGKYSLYKTIKADFKLALKGPLLFCTLGVTLGFCFDNWQDLQNFFITPLMSGTESGISVLYFFFNSFSFGGVFSGYFSTIMAAVPFSANYCHEVDGGISIYKIARCGRPCYVRSKFLVASVLGGLTLSIGGLIFILVLASYLPLTTPDQVFELSWLPFSGLLTDGKELLYFASVLYISFLGGALWASIGLCASAFIPNAYVAICSPFICRFILVQIGRMLRLPYEFRLDLLLEARVTAYSDSITLLMITSAVLVLIFLCGYLFSKRVERRIISVE